MTKNAGAYFLLGQSVVTIWIDVAVLDCMQTSKSGQVDSFEGLFFIFQALKSHLKIALALNTCKVLSGLWWVNFQICRQTALLA